MDLASAAKSTVTKKDGDLVIELQDGGMSSEVSASPKLFFFYNKLKTPNVYALEGITFPT